MAESNTLFSAESEVLLQAIEAFRVYSGNVLLSFAKHGQGLRDTVARNFIARGRVSRGRLNPLFKEPGAAGRRAIRVKVPVGLD